MRNSIWKRVFALFVCTTLIVVSSVAVSFVAKESRHTCCEPECQVCSQLEVATAVLNRIGSGLPLGLVVAAAIVFVMLEGVCVIQESTRLTPVRLKVQLNS